MLIQGGTVVTPAGERRGDVRCAGERIAAVAAQLDPQPGEEVIDARGCLVLPGVVDAHTHLWLEGQTADDPASATAAAAAGGVTTCIDFCVQHEGETFSAAAAGARRRTEGAACVDFALHLTVTRLFDGWEADLERLVAEGVTSAKVYTTYKGTVFYADDHTILRLLERSGQAGLLVQMHAESDDLLEGAKRDLLAAGQTGLEFHGAARPAVAEEEAVSRGLFFSRVTGSPIYFVHLSSPRSVDLVSEAKAAGRTAFAETCPHFLCLDETAYSGANALRCLMTPPLRPRHLVEGLWRRLEDGAIDAIGSDHCGFSLEQRGTSRRFDEVNPGIPGLETSLPLLFGRIETARLVALLSENPARIFGLYPRKGSLEVGSDADLVILDPSARGPLRDDEIRSRAGFTPFAGQELMGRVRTTLSRGRAVFDRGELHADPTWGRFLDCEAFDARRIA